MPRCILWHSCSFNFFLGFEKAKINLMRHLDDDVINGKMMFVGTNISGDLTFAPKNLSVEFDEGL